MVIGLRAIVVVAQLRVCPTHALGFPPTWVSDCPPGSPQQRHMYTGVPSVPEAMTYLSVNPTHLPILTLIINLPQPTGDGLTLFQQ